MPSPSQHRLGRGGNGGDDRDDRDDRDDSDDSNDSQQQTAGSPTVAKATAGKPPAAPAP